jgi:hypothetical protein
MRGSPLFRTLLVLAALLIAALGLARLTAPARSASVTVNPPVQAPVEKSATTFELLLSGAAKSVTLEAGGAPFLQKDSAGPLAGTLEIAGEAPLVTLRIEWADAAPGHRFAKLRLDRPGKDSLEHVFSAPGDIDDIWEP